MSLFLRRPVSPSSAGLSRAHSGSAEATGNDSATQSEGADLHAEVPQFPQVDNKMDFSSLDLIKTIIKAVIKMQVQFGPL